MGLTSFARTGLRPSDFTLSKSPRACPAPVGDVLTCGSAPRTLVNGDRRAGANETRAETAIDPQRWGTPASPRPAARRGLAGWVGPRWVA